MRMLGHILLWAGFLAGSLLTVFNSTNEGVEYTKGLYPKMNQLKKKISKQEEILATPDLQESEPEKFVKAQKELAKLEKELKPLEQVQTAVSANGLELEELTTLSAPENGWHLIAWGQYSAAALFCFAGVVLLHMTRLTANQKSEESAASLSEIKRALSNAVKEVEALAKVSSQTAPSKIAARIDEQIADELRIFADGRDSMTTEYGLTVFADVMSPFAAGERAINRAWSAAADGYVDEATTCIERSLMMFKDAQTELEQAEKNVSQG